MATLLPYCLRLDCTVASTIPRLASGGVAIALPDGISTRMATHPCFVAHYVINSDYPFGYLRCILCGLPDLHLLYNGVFIMGLCSSPLAYTILPSSAGGLTLFQSDTPTNSRDSKPSNVCWTLPRTFCQR